MFTTFINKRGNRRIEIAPFKKDNEFIYDGKGMYESLKSKYISQQSEISNRENSQPFEDSSEGDLVDI